MYLMVGLAEDERVFSPVRQSVRRRLPWMLVNLLTAFAAAATISLFDSTLSRATVLAFLMPIVAGMGGNAGTQTATIAVRSIALGDLHVTDVVRACRKEILVGVANGIAVGLAAAAVSYLWEGSWPLSAVLAGALIANVVTATMAGVLIPLGLKALKVDPALAANIFVTMTTDITGFILFLGLATLAINQIT
jgi:magnesium transporter